MYDELLLTNQSAVTATGNSGTVITSRLSKGVIGNNLVLYVDTTAVSGTTPTMNLTVSGIVNGKAYTLTPTPTFVQITATGQARYVFTDAPRDIRINWAIGGTTPSFTFNIRCSRGG